MRPLSVSEFYKVSDAIIRIIVLYKLDNLPITQLVETALGDVVAILDTLTTIQGYEDVNISTADIDAACLPLLFGRFMESVAPKKWEALGAQLIRQFGLTAWVQDFKAKMQSAVQSEQ